MKNYAFMFLMFPYLHSFLFLKTTKVSAFVAVDVVEAGYSCG
jgi:hypothetical protein